MYIQIDRVLNSNAKQAWRSKSLRLSQRDYSCKLRIPSRHLGSIWAHKIPTQWAPGGKLAKHEARICVRFVIRRVFQNQNMLSEYLQVPGYSAVWSLKYRTGSLGLTSYIKSIYNIIYCWRCEKDTCSFYEATTVDSSMLLSVWLPRKTCVRSMDQYLSRIMQLVTQR